MYDAPAMRALRTVTIAAALIGAAPAADAWTGPTRVQMVDDAIKMMPPTLRGVLVRRRQDVLRGMLEPMTHEDGPAHRPASDGGSLEGSIDEATRSLVRSVGPGSFHEVARRFGSLAHFVADAGFPPGAATKPDERRYAHFATFCESRRPRFPLVFYGHDNAALARGDLRGFARGILARSRDQDADLARAYAAAPSWSDPVAFDDRSVPFAVASLSYSHAVTDIVQAWLEAWSQSHGDMAGTPYASADAHR